MKFTKMHGTGNDYVYVNCFEQRVDDPGALAIKVSDRRFGIGGDGLVLICPSEIADMRMDIYNADGSRAKMCGNAARCVGKYAYEHSLVNKTEITLETLSGIKKMELHVKDGTVDRVKVNMGAPIFMGSEIPTVFDEDVVVQKAVEINGSIYEITCVSMGNPHCVVFDEDPMLIDFGKIGPSFEKSSLFPEGVNTEFVKVTDRENIIMRVWERGSGETLACGTGACASVAACVLCGKTRRKVTVHLRGGDLEIEWNEQTGEIYMSGPAVEVFSCEVSAEQMEKW